MDTRQNAQPNIASDQDLPLTISTTQAAKLCGVSPTTLRKWVRLGLPTVPFDGDYRFSPDALREFLKTGRQRGEVGDGETKSDSKAAGEAEDAA